MKPILLLATSCLLAPQAFAQFPACTPPNFVTTDRFKICEACTWCEFDGYSGTTLPYNPDWPNWTVFCGIAANLVVVNFIAGTDNITFTATPGACVDGNGLQMYLWNAEGTCNDTEGPIACEIGQMGGGGIPLSFQYPTIPGQNYLIMVAGWNGDQCDFDLTISPPGAAQAPPPGSISGNIEGPAVLCPGGTATYSVASADGAGYYIWTVPPGWLVNGAASPVSVADPAGTSVAITAGPMAGSGQICVRPATSCFLNQPNLCRTVSVVPIPPTIFPSNTICHEELPYELPWGAFANGSGLYSEVLNSFFGCDSLVQQQLTVIPELIKNLPDKYICQGDFFSVCGQNYSEDGEYTAHCLSYQGCDSTVNFELFVLAPVAQIYGDAILTCQTDTVVLSAAASPGNTSFTWKTPLGQLLGITEQYTVTAPGTYILNATLSGGGLQCMQSDTIVVTGNTTPPSLTATGGMLSCTTGTAQLSATSDADAPNWAWSGPGGFTSSAPNPSVTVMGNYTVTVTSGAGSSCTASATVAVTNDTAPLTLSATGGNLTCVPGSVQLTAVSNAADPGWSWMGPGGFASALANPVATAAGTYSVTVTAAGNNACTATATVAVTDDTAPPALTTAGATLTCSVLSAAVAVNSAGGVSAFSWTGPNGFSSALQTPTVNAAGVYTVTATGSANGCTSSATALVALDDTPPGATIAGGSAISCQTPAVGLSGGPGAAGNTFLWSGPNFSSAQQNVTVDTAGLYTLTVSGPNGCTSTATANVTSTVAAINATAQGGTLSCAAPLTTLSGTSPATGPSFAWTGPGGYASSQQNPADVSLPGIYMLTVTDMDGCTGTATASVVQDVVPPDASAVGGTIDCNNSQIQLAATAATGISYAWTGPDNFTSTEQNPSVASDGDYVVTVTGANGCTGTATAVVGLDIAPPAVQAAAPDILSCAQTSVNIQADIGAAPPLQMLAWAGPNGFVSNAEDPAVDEPGLYSLTAIAANGCSAVTEAFVNQDINSPDVSAQGGILTCNATSVVLDGSSAAPAAGFAWTGPNNFISTLEDPIASESGIYSLTVTGANGCSAVAEAVVGSDTVAPDLNASSSNDLTCNDLSTTLNGESQTAGVTYSWAGPNNFTAATATATASASGIYQLTATAPNGCFSIENVAVAQDIALPGASAAGGTIDCISGQATLAGDSPAPGASYAWTGPNNFASSEQNPAVNQNGAYFLTVTGQNGCTSTANAQIEENTQSPEVELQGGGTLSCVVTEISLTGIISTPGASGIWSGPNNFSSVQSNIIISFSGNYTYTVLAQNGCVSAPAISILENVEPPQAVSATGGALNCTFPSINLTANSGTPGVLYAWAGPGNFFSDQPNPAVSAPGIYTLTVTDPVNGCTASATAEVTQDPAVPDIAVSAEPLTCSTQTATLDANSTLGVAFAWTGPNGFSSALEDPAATAPGVYSVTVTAASGCTTALDFALTQDISPPNVSAQGTTLTCASPGGQIIGHSDTSGVSYAWAGPGGFSSTLAGPTVTLPGNYTVIATAPNGCTSSATAVVSSDMDFPAISATGGTLTCAQPSLVLNATSDLAASWQWSGPGGLNSTLQNPTATVAGNYGVTATAANGCSATAAALVAANTQSPAFSIEEPAGLDCTTAQVGLSAQVQGPGNFDYQWTTQNGLILSGAGTPTPQVGQAGTYQVLVTDLANGCSALQSVAVEANPASPTAVALAERDISCFGRADGSLTIGAVQGGTAPFLYSIDSQILVVDTVYNSLLPGLHTLLVQDANGCEYQTSFTLSEPPELSLDLGPDTTIHLGDGILISLGDIVNFPDRVTQVFVTPADVPLDSLFLPTASLDYRVTVLDSNGCEASDERSIRVDRARRIYIPNAFNPAGGQNAVLYISGGSDVDAVEFFQIYDRWGELVFERFDFPPNDPAHGWTGSYRGREASPGVFVYQVMIRFIDGEKMLFRGDVTVWR